MQWSTPSLRSASCFAGGSGSDHLRADLLRDLRRGDADTAAGRVHEHALARVQASHHADQLPGGEVVDREGGALRRIHAIRAHEDLRLGHADHVAVAAEAREREDVRADPVFGDAGADGVDPARDLVAHDDRHARGVRVHPQSSHDVREVDADGPTRERAPGRPRRGVRGLAQLEHLGGTGSRDPDLTHSISSDLRVEPTSGVGRPRRRRRWRVRGCGEGRRAHRPRAAPRSSDGGSRLADLHRR